MKRRDPFFLAERYTVDCDCERMAELLRFVYQGEMSFFDLRPKSDTEREVLVHKMLHMCIDAEKYSVDALYEKLLVWLGDGPTSITALAPQPGTWQPQHRLHGVVDGELVL